MKIQKLLIATLLGVTSQQMLAQTNLYPQLFNLGDVTITGRLWHHAMMLNDSVLLSYDAGRLMQPFERQAGIKESGPRFVNWAGLDGHVGGHYVSALAMSYASCKDAHTKQLLGERLDWCLNRLKACQQKWDENNNAVMHGYVGGVPDSYKIFTDFAQGNTDIVFKYWVPFYNVHKIYAGLRDAWLYAGREEGKQMFLKLCDWGVNLLNNLPEDKIEASLNQEHGGMNEMFADAYQITGDAKYLKAAELFSHKWLLNNMAEHNAHALDNHHANTQVPKVVGFERVYQLNKKPEYGEASRFFWEDVATQRTIALGGNSVNEWFPASNRYDRFITSSEGVESCNTYNMMKLSEDIFMEHHEGKYADFYEQAMINHILSTQNPKTGGYVYFTSARPQHYRVYSQVNKAMWCCVGTGMENHGKYGEFVYSHSLNNDSLWVNLFVGSDLNWKARKITISQTTDFPFEEQSNITVNGKGRFTMLVRIPQWTDGYRIQVNGQYVNYNTVNGYAAVNRKWKKGDKVTVMFPMHLTIQPLQNYNQYVAIKYGPVLLGAKTSTDNMKGLYAEEDRMGQIASGPQKNLLSAPVLVGDRKQLIGAIQPLDKRNLTFKINGYYNDPKFNNLVLQPFFTIHESRYMMYWMNVTQDEWNDISTKAKAREDSIQALEARTIDHVVVGTQQSESDHFMSQQSSNFGNYRDEYFRTADKGEFSYKLNIRDCNKALSLMVRYWGKDKGSIRIYVDNKELALLSSTDDVESFINKEFNIPTAIIKDKKEITVRFVPSDKNMRLFYIRLLNQQ